MRTISFRGKRIDGKGFAYGDLLTGCGYKKGRYFILPQLDFYPSDCSSLDGYEIIPDTVGQFTGLTDKNGKEIYEGDIVKTKQYGKELDRGGDIVIVSGYDVFEIKYINAQFMFNNRRRYHYLHRNAFCEVIGNIHDNPELLKEA